MTRKARIGLLLVLAMVVVLTVCVAPAVAAGATLMVGTGHTYTTIQAAVDAATGSGDEIVVYAGTYAENVLISNKNNLTIRGVGDTTLVEGNGIGFRIHTSSGITIENLKIHTVGAGNHGINVDGEALGGGVSNNLIVRNTTIVTEETGIIGDSVAAGVHSTWLITGNRITGAGGGIGLQDVTNSTISNNTITIADGTNIYWTSERYNLTALVIEHNTVSGSGGSQVSVMTDWNEISGGTAVPVESPVVPTTITGVTFHGNTFANWGSRAIRVGDGSGGSATGTITGIVIDGNTFQMTADTAQVIGGTDQPSATGGLNIFNVTAPAKIQKAADVAFATDTINGVVVMTYTAGSGGSIVGSSTQSVNFGSDGTTVTATPGTGYHFVSWSDIVATAARKDKSDRRPALTGDITVSASFALNSCTISFDSNGGSAVTAITQDCGTAVTAPTDPTKTGNTFAGWYSDVALATPYTFGTMPASNITLYAKWTAIVVSHTITFNSNDGSAVTAITQADGSAVTAPTPPTKTGSTFAGWYSNEGLTTPYAFTTMPASNTTLYAKWTVTPVLMPVWRFYNMRTGAHFYTASATEMANVRDTLYRTYRLEGVAYYVNTANPANNTPLYRFYNFKKGVHFYTASESEKDNVLRTLSSTYRLEGVAYYVSLASSGAAAPVYRFYNFKKGVHFYTASESEKDNVVRTLWSTYRLEGVGFYLAP